MDLLDQFFGLFSDFSNPKKRIFLGYIGISALIAFGWLVIVRRASIGSSLRRIFDPKILFSGSAFADYKIFVINRVFTGFISPLLLTQVTIATAVYMALVRSDIIPWGGMAGVSKPVVIALFSVAMFVVDDFTKYLVHRWMHNWPMLWFIHKVHHGAETMSPITVYRVHPLEGVLYAMRGVVAQGSVISLFFFLFGSKVDLYTVVGVNVIVFIFHVTGSNLRHSHIDIRYPRWLEHIFISPAQHQIHHSIAAKHYDKNFGGALAVWDWIFGSLHVSEGQGDFKFGLTKSEGHSATDLKTIYFAPLWEIARFLVRKSVKVKEFVARVVKRTPTDEVREDLLESRD
ncbi:MAG: sterol desaturase family protein [Litoreibacter sp.]|uniref:sterol desaturase family protein n=1 Tax=Litoreibacter sp. TaxID=1969459 RepID=UPI0032978465